MIYLEHIGLFTGVVATLLVFCVGAGIVNALAARQRHAMLELMRREYRDGAQ